MSKLREAEEELFRAWRGSSLSEMIAAVHAMDDALEEDRLTAAVLAEREACAKVCDELARVLACVPYEVLSSESASAKSFARNIRERGEE